MQLIGMLDSPYVRRTAIALELLGLASELRPLSVFRDFDAFARINPLVKAPTLVCADGDLLVDSSLIIDYAQTISGKSLLPADPEQRRRTLVRVGVALVVAEKAVQIVYENKRPAPLRDAGWLARVQGQLLQGLAVLETQVDARDGDYFGGDCPDLADITSVVSWGFVQLMLAELATPGTHPALAHLALKSERLPAFRRWAIPAG